MFSILDAGRLMQTFKRPTFKRIKVRCVA